MAKALVGHLPTGADLGRVLSLGAEVRRLRARVAELETALEHACQANEELHRQVAPMVLDDAALLELRPEPVLT